MKAFFKVSSEVVIALIGGIATLIGAIVEGIRHGERHWYLSERVSRLEERMISLERQPPVIEHIEKDKDDDEK